MTKRDSFRLPSEPRTGLDLVWWTLLEWRRLRAWSEALPRLRVAVLHLRALPWLVLMALAFYALSMVVITAFDLPSQLPDQFRDTVVRAFQASPHVGGRLAGLLAATGADFVIGLTLLSAGGLAVGLAGGLAVGLAVGLAAGMAGGLAGDLPGGLAVGLAGGLAVGLVVGLVMGLTAGLEFGLAGGLAFGLAWSLAVGLVGGLAVGLAVGIVTGSGLFAGWVLSILRVPFYLPESLAALVRLDLRHNPYLYDAGVRLPIWGAERRLTAETFRDPETGAAFAAFLLEYRPLQRALAAAVLHAAQAGRWRLRPLDAEVLAAVPLPDDQPKFQPRPGWVKALAGLRADLMAFRTQTQITLKRDAFERFCTRLAEFRQLTAGESPSWNRWYLDALTVWESEAAKERLNLADQAATLEPIAQNRYRAGTPLRPESDRPVFFGREDLRETLARRVLTSAELPLFLLLGQRRVGKTSLLNFLPELLGSGFTVVVQDLQDDRVEGVTSWLADLRRRVAERLQRRDGDWTPPADWLAAWRGLREWLEGLAPDGDRKLILALDEYEALHEYLERDPEQGARLLAAMRSFSQHQNRVVLLLVGATPLAELRDPDWARYFVHTQTLRVDYLARPDALRLITEPVPLRYPSAVTERLFDLTQGHPDLLQRLCWNLVDIANRDGRYDMTMAALDESVAAVLNRDTVPMERFWNEFCRDGACRACLEQVLAGQVPTDRAAQLRLVENGYLLADQGRLRLRVPLFEDWLRRYRDAFPPAARTHPGP